ncbi:MAG: 30S ribosomal protein S15 [Candidatus Pacearchaeota archaeon]|nr:30S ribosomal protein S15 [Candidatus Pacearchaeota archaeon]
MTTKRPKEKQENQATQVTARKSDVICLEEHIENLKKHISKNKQDNPTKRALSRKEAKLKKLREYLTR